VKYTLPMVAMVLLGLAAGFHRATAGPVVSDRRPETVHPQVPESLAPEHGIPLVPSTVPVAEPLAPSKLEQPAKMAAPGKPETAPWKRMQGTLSQELSLNALQQGSVEQILRERWEEIRVCQDEILRSKVLDMRRYEWQVAGMKESWFKRIDGLLDVVQHERFKALAEQGIFNEGLGITEVQGMTVLD